LSLPRGRCTLVIHGGHAEDDVSAFRPVPNPEQVPVIAWVADLPGLST